MPPRRHEKVAKELHHVLAQLLIQAKDVRLRAMTITQVKLSPDLQIAHVAWRPFADQTPQAIEQALTKAAPFLRTAVGNSLHLRRVPQLIFHFDETAEQSRAMDELLTQLRAEGQMGNDIPPPEEESE